MPFDALISSARALAIAEKRPVLASLTERVRAVDLLQVLESLGRDSGFGPMAHELARGLMYWACPSDDFAMAGVGAAATVTAQGEGRFAAVDRQWDALIDGALVESPADAPPGAGPVAMGGFAFDEHRAASDAWRDFPSAHLIVPRLQLTSVDGECWLTSSVLVAADGEPDVGVDAVLDLKSHLDVASTGRNGSGDYSISDEPPEFSDSPPADEWRDMVSRAIGEIRAGGMQKVVLARAVRVSASRDLNVFTVIRQLQSSHRNSFVFGYWRRDSAFVGASPERLVRLDGRQVKASSLAGTARRGDSPGEDVQVAELLMTSAKDLEEHAAVTDSLRAKLAEVCEDVKLDDKPALLTLPHLHHLHTAVTGKLRSDSSLLELVGRLHPTPAVGGTPRSAALDFIRENENLDRGWYAAPIGWVGRDGGEFAVSLRSGVITGNEATLFAGCGIVGDSNPDLELAESVLKFKPMESAISASLSASPFAATTIAATDRVQ